MKKFLLAKTLLSAAVCALCLSAFGGCTGLNINDRSNTSYAEPSDGGDYWYYGLNLQAESGYALKIDKATGEFSLDGSGLLNGEDNDTADGRVVLYGSDFPRREPCYAEGWERAVTALTETYEKQGVEYVQFYAVTYEEGLAHGFCNMYSSAAGFLSGGGNISADKIVGSAFFTVDGDGGITEIKYFEKCNVIAFNSDCVIYWKGEKYYAFDCVSGTEKYVCDDEAYDKGITNYSHSRFVFNADLCIIIMCRRYSDSSKDYYKIVACGYDGEVAFTAQVNEPV